MAEPSEHLGDAEQARTWLRSWRGAGAALELERARALRDIDVQVALRQLAGPIHDAIVRFPPEPTSGLVEMQAVFARWKSQQ
jgi:hypothetical protein